MLVANILLAAVVAVTSVVAAPGAANPGTSLVERGQWCKPGMVWNGFKKGCKCDSDYDYDESDYDEDDKKCHPKAHPDTGCGWGEKQYCARNEHEWCEYDKHNKLCWNTGGSKRFCCKPKDFPWKVKEMCPSHPTCDKPRHWDWEKRSCECPKGKMWHGGQCVWKPMEKPQCKKKWQVAYCGKDDKTFCPYDEWHPWCGDNSRHITFCCEPKEKKPEKKCKNKWDNGRDWDDDD